jgi:flavin-dependent dehydrogenase
MESCDALVVGGGPAGASCATWLARAGLDVLVLDRAVFPRDKACAGWITPQAVAALELDTRAYAHGRVLQPIRALRTCQLGAPAARVDYGEVVGWGVRRCEFDHYLLRHSGARMRIEAVQSLERVAGGFVVNERFRAPVVVGAGGQFCPVARALGAQRGARALVVAQEIEARMSPRDEQRCPVRPDTPELYFCGDLQGYGWIFRKGPFLNVGFGRRDARAFPARTQAFWKALRAAGRVPAGFAPPWPGHAYRVYEGAAPRLVDDGILLVGDAAGLAYAQSGEGIGPAVESGRLAAAAVVSAGNLPTRGRLMTYERALRSRFGARPAGEAESPVPAALRTSLAGVTLAVPFLSRRFVLDPTFLHRGQSALTDPRPYFSQAPALGLA